MGSAPIYLLVVSILVHLDDRTRVVEGRQTFHRPRLGVELDDGLHHLAVVVPVQALQVVGGQNVKLALPAGV